MASMKPLADLNLVAQNGDKLINLGDVTYRLMDASSRRDRLLDSARAIVTANEPVIVPLSSFDYGRYHEVKTTVPVKQAAQAFIDEALKRNDEVIVLLKGLERWAREQRLIQEELP